MASPRTSLQIAIEKSRYADTTTGQFDIVSILKDHYRAGYSRPLLWFDSLLLTVLVLDIWRFLLLVYRGSISLAALRYSFLSELPHDTASGPFGSDLFQITFLILLMMIILPALIAIIRIAGWFGDAFGGPLSASPSHIFIFHSLVCVIISLALVAGHAAEVVSGQAVNLISAQARDADHYLFQSSLYDVLVKSHILTWVFLTLGFGLIVEVAHASIAYILHGHEFANPVKQYLVRAELADLPAEWLPIGSPVGSSIEPAQNQPKVRLINEAYARRSKELHRFRLGSTRNLQLVDLELEKCNVAIRSRLFGSSNGSTTSSGDSISMKLFVGPRRAFEAALARVPRPRILVQSPFVSPSIATLVKWHSFLTGDELRMIEFLPRDYFRPWNEQESMILDRLRSCYSNSPASIIFVTSDVFYASGRRIPLTLLDTLRGAMDHERLNIVMDGTNAVGNDCLIPTSAAWNSYVFSAQRWLMAAEPCGVLLCRDEPAAPGPEAPGAIRPGASNGEIQLRALAGFASALESIGQQKEGVQFFFSRCERLRRELRLGLPATIQIVGDGLNLDETFIISCCPREKHSWKLDNAAQLEYELSRRRVKASVVKLNPLCPWVRMALPFYLDAREIAVFTRFLRETTS